MIFGMELMGPPWGTWKYQKLLVLLKNHSSSFSNVTLGLLCLLSVKVSMTIGTRIIIEWWNAIIWMMSFLLKRTTQFPPQIHFCLLNKLLLSEQWNCPRSSIIFSIPSCFPIKGKPISFYGNGPSSNNANIH